MKYQFILSYKATDSDEVLTNNNCHPVYGDDLSVTIDREDGELYYKRKLDGKITFERDDYRWIMARPFDGTFTLTVNETHDGGASWHPYFEGTFSRANLEIDEDNQAASLSSFIEGVYNAIENGKDEDYDLMKIIPDGDAREVQGQVHPALAMVDEFSPVNKAIVSDVFCHTPIQSGGYNEDNEDFWGSDKNMNTNPKAHLQTVIAEAKFEMNNESSNLNGNYTGYVSYVTLQQHGSATMPDFDFYKSSLVGTLYNIDRTHSIDLTLWTDGYGSNPIAYIQATLPSNEIRRKSIGTMYREDTYYSPMSYEFNGDNQSLFKKLTIKFHYIYSLLLLQSSEGIDENILETGPYYKGSTPFQGSGLTITPSVKTVEQPNRHRLLPGTGEQGTTPQYYSQPDNTEGWIPLNENNWDYASMWYKIVPSVANGLLDETKIGSFRWTRCWTLGTVLRYLLDRITDGKVVFTEDTTSSQFLYSTVNPVNQHEPFDYLITQKSNVMNPGQDNTHESAARCTVRLNWFLELLRNAFNCYYWLEKRNDGKYLFRVEHVEYFRRCGHYDGTLPAGIDITAMKPRRNFRNQLNQLAKTYADQTNKYAYNMQNMVEKYTFSWQGDGGSDAFKGNPMFFKAGWIEKSSSEDHQVDNIFADLAWLMLNSGTDTDSSKNYYGVFLFSGYQSAEEIVWKENSHPTMQNFVLAAYSRIGNVHHVECDIWVTIPNGQIATLKQGNTTIETYTGTGESQLLSINVTAPAQQNIWIDFGANYANVTINRIRIHYGNVYRVPNTTDLLNTENYLQNGPLAWPWLQNEHLHYDIPAKKWSYLYDNLQDIQTEDWEADGTVKMIQKQTVKPVPITDKGTEDSIMDITGIHTSIEGGKTGIITNAKINLSSRNAELTIVYDPVPEENQ